MYRRTTFILAIVSVFLGVVLVGQLSMNSPWGSTAAIPSPQAAASESGPAGDSPIARRDPQDPMAIGAVDAPVVLIEWIDLRCPYCAAFHRETLPTLVDEYVERGLVRIEVHDVAYFGEQSEDAAVAARAAARQNRFFYYLDALFAAAPAGGQPELPREQLIAFAEEAEVPDLARFTADLDDPQLRSGAQASTQQAQRLGVSGVPFFVAGNRAVSGAQPIDAFREFLDQAIDEAR